DEYLRRFLHTGQAHILQREREVVGLRKGNVTFPMVLWVTEAGGKDKRQFVGVVRDISDRRRQSVERDKLFEAIQRTVTTLASTSNQILAAVTEQSASAQQQASAVNETVATVEEITQT